MNTALAAAPALRTDYRLSDNLWATAGTVFLTGTQALIRLMAMQQALDTQRGLHTAGFISGYRGSPLGMVDQQVWKAQPRLDELGIRFLPAINEELAATAVLGTQRVESDPQRTVEGVFALWYGKGPGVDRAGDALKHGNAYGSSPHGGVLVVAGDDHGCVSSSTPHQSDQAFQAWSVPTVSPATVAEMLEFGLYGWALSRFSGAWVGFTALSEVVESGTTVDLDPLAQRVSAWHDADTVRARTGYTPPADGLHYRWPDLPSLTIEARLHAKLDAVRAFARVNPIDRTVIASERATFGIVTAGKAHVDLMEVFRRLDLSPDDLAAAGLRLYKVGLTFPVEPTRLTDFAAGLREILVIEEKGPVVETQLRELFYNAPADQRPTLLGKRDAAGQPLVSALGELRPSRLIALVAAWVAARFPALDRRHLVVDFTLPALLHNDADGVRRAPYFCAGCPHNTSTKVPDGSRAQAGIGCHFMATWMNRETEGLIQMGGEGVDWVSHAMFTREPHVFQNLGDGTYYHSGYLAIRQAVAAQATLTYKILFNDAVAMTGGQPVDGVTSVDRIARQVEAEGVRQVVVLSDDIRKYDGQHAQFPPGTTFHDRSELDAVQRRLREVPGVTVLIYEQTCAAEKRRRRKKKELVDPPKRLFIHQAVCEGCGDCTVQSNCVAVLPEETPFGRKRRIDQSSCNKDYSCAKGFCPSFVGVVGGRLKKHVGALVGAAGADSPFRRRIDALPLPAAHVWVAPYDLLVTGVGGTGVVTVGALIAMAAHLEGKAASVLDFMGFAQKGGAVLSFVRLADRPERLHQVRIDAQQADALLACDLVVGASADALQTVRHGRTRVLANTHETPVAESLRNPDASLQAPLLLQKIEHAAGAGQVRTLDAQRLAEDFLGDAIVSNIVALGFAWQAGLVPVSLAAMQRAIALNGVAVENNQNAFALGRLAAADPAACRALLDEPAEDAPAVEPLDALIARGMAHLTAYQDAAWAQRWRALVDEVRTAESAAFTPPSRHSRESGNPRTASTVSDSVGARLREHDGADASASASAALPLTRAVATQLLRLMAYKDEYEVARLYTDPAFRRSLDAQFEGDFQLEFHMAPPLLARPQDGQPPRKLRLGAWLLPAMRWLAKGKALRGTALDLFGRTDERRTERELIGRYEARVRELLAALAVDASPRRRALAVQIASVPHTVRGFGHVKLANLALAQVREAELLHRFDPAAYPPPAGAGVPVAGQFKGIRVETL